jgi:hypothetical protein
MAGGALRTMINTCTVGGSFSDESALAPAAPQQSPSTGRQSISACVQMLWGERR